MIIISISAENLLKYASLELTDLPDTGIIAVSGQNESGKSTIGESICFALFGRTFSFSSDKPEKIICWGQARCSAEVVFSAAGEEQYRITRSLDNEGNQSACLSRNEDAENPIASGVASVNDAMFSLLGFDYDEFIESFYLAQREITTPHRNSQAIKAMAGLATMDAVSADVHREITEEQVAIEELDSEIVAIDAKLQVLDIQEGYLQVLEADFESLNAVQEEREQQVSDLQSAAIAYTENIPRLKRAHRGRRSMIVLCSLMAVGSVLSGNAAWGPWADDPMDGFLWGQFCGLMLLMLMVATGGFFIMIGRIQGLSKTPKILVKKLRDIQRINAVVQEGSSKEITAVEVASEDAKDVYTAIAEYTAKPEVVAAIVKPELDQAQQENQARLGDIECLSKTISEENVRLQQATELTQARKIMEGEMAGHQHEIKVRLLAEDLLDGAGKELSQRFNRDLRELAGHTLPLFTDGRYEHLRIDDDLNVQVFSNEKRDFMSLDEVSSGTQRQIMLAVRLALSQKLIDSAMTGKQFVFLDEPFAFFDRERTKSTLAVLPQLSDEITQVWIVSQDFPDDSQLDRRVICSRDYLCLVPDTAISE